MMEQNTKTSSSQIVQVSFFEPVNGKKDYFFGSLKAIYAMFSKEVIGCSLETLYAAKITVEKAKMTSTCRISKRVVTRISH